MHYQHKLCCHFRLNANYCCQRMIELRFLKEGRLDPAPFWIIRSHKFHIINHSATYKCTPYVGMHRIKITCYWSCPHMCVPLHHHRHRCRTMSSSHYLRWKSPLSREPSPHDPHFGCKHYQRRFVASCYSLFTFNQFQLYFQIFR